MQLLRLLLISTPVAPLGSGLGGGVELTVTNLAQVLAERGHCVAIAAPIGSVLPAFANPKIQLVQIEGECQPTAQTQGRLASVVVSKALANAWAYARQVQSQYDVLVNFSYDWLPFYLTPLFKTPIAHFVTMGSLNNALDDAIAQIARQFPGTLGAYTRSQAKTFPNADLAESMVWEILGGGIDLSDYDYCAHPGSEIAWVGRISPEKGLEDAVAAAMQAECSLNIFGKIEDPDYWQQIQSQTQPFADGGVIIRYCGFLPTTQLQKKLGRCQALLMTPRWLEAFGMVAIEALACGVPVITYAQGGPAEIVRSGETGYWVVPGDVDGLVKAIAQIDKIDRRRCRHQAESMYSLDAWGKRFEQWLYKIVAGEVAGKIDPE